MDAAKVPTRRALLRFGALLAVAPACTTSGSRAAKPSTRRAPTPEENRAVWRALAGQPYEAKAPGVCPLPGPDRKTRFPDPDKYKNTTHVHSMCQLCSTVCGITGIVKDGRVLKVEGNPRDPNSRGKLCARGQAALNLQYHPERLLYPLERVGKRGEGRWRRITWDQAYDKIAERLRRVKESGKLEEFAFHQGRSRTPDAVNNFLAAFGTNTALNHRGLCSAARRAANLTSLFESDWDLGDYENSKYILNFGSNIFEAHQGHVAGAQRIQRGRFENGAKLVTFDVRMSNTAGCSDEYFMPAPGTDGAVALAMGNAILAANAHDETFLKEWTNASIDELRAVLAPYTPEWAESVSTIRAADIRRIALEFAAAAPRATTICNRGTSAHVNGYWNDRAVILLNALVGSVGAPGGWCWMYTGGIDSKRFPAPLSVPKPKTPSLLADPPEFVLANAWNEMKVGEIVYWYLANKRAHLQVYMTYNLDSPLTWPEMDVTQNVLLDESAIEFHVCINPFLNETAAMADLVLPWTTYLERWDIDARGAYNLKPYVALRQPIVPALGEAKDVREIFPELARRVGGDMATLYPNRPPQEYMADWVRNVPADEQGRRGLERLAHDGAFEDPSEAPYYQPFLKPLSDAQLEGATLDEATGVYTKDGKGVGVKHRGVAVVGFKTPSRKFEIRSEFVRLAGLNQDTSELAARASSKARRRPAHHAGHDYEISPWPIYAPIEEHQSLREDELVMTSFKWCVHNHGRSAQLKWLSEIVHSNPAWLHPDTARRLGLADGDFIELVGRRSLTLDKLAPKLALGSGELKRTLRLPIWITPAVHPRAVAISNSLGHWEYSNVAKAVKGVDGLGSRSEGMDLVGYRDPDWERNMWWEDRSGGDPRKWRRNRGAGWAQNHVMPIAADPISGQQSFNSTVVRVRKVT